MLKCIKKRVLRIDRIEVPTFYIEKSPTFWSHGIYVGLVMAVVMEHPKLGWLAVGAVSRQSPLGQGTRRDVQRSELRQAPKAQVLEALARDHAFVKSFRPPELLRGSGRCKTWPMITTRQRKVVVTASSAA